MVDSEKAKERPKRRDHYQEATDRIIQALEEGTAPWQRPWDGSVAQLMRPCSGHYRRAYRGINVPLLMCRGFADPRWYTFNQIKQHGWSVRKGEAASQVYFYKKVFIPESQLRNKGFMTPTAGDDMEFDGGLVSEIAGGEIPVAEDILGFGGDPGQSAGEQAWGAQEGASVPVLRAFPVFNAEQIEGDVPSLSDWLGLGDREWDANEVAEQTVQRLRDTTGLGWVTGPHAAYEPARDRVIMPPESSFPTATNYYSTALHEVGHATMHPSRLDRKVGLETVRGSEEYAREELRAEMASLFLGLDLGVPHDPDQHAAYVNSWLKALKADKKELFRAARDAQAIADYVVGHAPEFVQEAVRARYQQPEAKTPEPAPEPSVAPEVPASAVSEPEPDFAWA